MQEQCPAGVDEVSEKTEIRTRLVIVLFAKLMEVVDAGSQIVTAGRLGGEEVGRLEQRVLVIALLRRADAAERRRPSAEAGADVAEQRALDLVAERRAAADDREILLAPLRFQQEVVREHSVVVQRVEADRITDRAQALQIGDVAE